MSSTLGGCGGPSLEELEAVDKKTNVQSVTKSYISVLVGPNFQDIGYDSQWWSARAGDHPLNLAWGHGGQLIVLVNTLDMVVVVTADPLYGQTGEGPWSHEKANINLVADFVSSLPSE